MKLVQVETKIQRKKFIQFIYQVYEKDSSFKDTLIGVVKTFLNKEDTFTQESYIKPITVEDESGILAQCMLIYNEKLPVLQIGFFDALKGQEKAVDVIINEAIREARQFKINKVVIGLNGHVSYGVGFLLDHYQEPIPFDSLYNKAYYTGYFERYAFKRTTLTTYSFLMKNIVLSENLLKRTYAHYTYRYLNMSRFEDEMKRFGDLCNEALKDTYLYFPRNPICMVELLHDLKPFLIPENLIFAMKDGLEIGFVFWHPDYNEFIPGGKKNSMVEIGVRYLFRHHKIKNMVINAIGVVEPYHRTSVAAGLLNEMYKVTKDRYIGGESNFVFDNNLNSRLFNVANTDRENRHYCVYEIEL